MPSTMGPNPAYAAAQKNLIAVQKQATDAMKVYATMADTVYKEQGAAQRTADTNASRETYSSNYRTV